MIHYIVTCILALLDRIPCMKQCSPPSSLTSSICSVFGQHLFQFMHPQQCYFPMTFRKSVFGQCVWLHLAKIIFNQTSAYSMLKTYMQPSSSMACTTALSWYFHVPVSWINQWWLYKPEPSGTLDLTFSAAEEQHQIHGGKGFTFRTSSSVVTFFHSLDQQGKGGHFT